MTDHNQGRKCHALVRNKDGKFHTGSTQAHNFTSIGKLYTAGLRNALDWFAKGRVKYSEDYGYEPGNQLRDMSEYTIVEYLCTEVNRTPADKWMREHGSQNRWK